MIKRKHWKWRGIYGHFIAASDCAFRLCTDIGKYRISTVGAYYPKSEMSEVMGQIGAGHHYETFVFTLGANGKISDYTEIDRDYVTFEGDPYASDAKAEERHERMCVKWAKQQKAS